MKKIQIRYYAIMREERGLGEETVKTNAATVQKLYENLRAAHRFSVPKEYLKVALNDVFVDWDKKIKNGDTVIFVPPVAGG